MTYGYVYVAQVAMGADYNQCIKAFTEAESYHGPSLIIAYAPCINQGIKGGMSQGSGPTIKNAVAAGYWHMFRFDPQTDCWLARIPSSWIPRLPQLSYQSLHRG